MNKCIIEVLDGDLIKELFGSAKDVYTLRDLLPNMSNVSPEAKFVIQEDTQKPSTLHSVNVLIIYYNWIDVID